MIAIIDYQMGNLRSVQKALETVGAEAVITSDPSVLEQADKVILPGVGAFEDAIKELQQRDLVSPIQDLIASGKPLLGICLGLQLLFDVSYEGGEFEGLGVIAGTVRRFDIAPEFKVPHMGWNEVQIQREAPIFRGMEQDTYFYFVHSYYVIPDDESVVALTSHYDGEFCGAIIFSQYNFIRRRVSRLDWSYCGILPNSREIVYRRSGIINLWKSGRQLT